MVLKVKDLSELLKLKKHTILYHIRTKQDVKGLFNTDVKDNSYFINIDKAITLVNKLFDMNVIDEKTFNSALDFFNSSVKGGVKDSVKDSHIDGSVNAEISRLVAENKYLKDVLTRVEDEVKTLKSELLEKNKQIEKLIDDNYVSKQLMFQFQIERNNLIECKPNKKRWWQKLFK